MFLSLIPLGFHKSVPLVIFLLNFFFNKFDSSVDALNVLISAPNFFPSHLWMHSEIADLLVEEGGHNVTFLASIWNSESGIPPERSNWTRAQSVIRHYPNASQLEVIRQSIAEMPFENSDIWTGKDALFTSQTRPLISNIFSSSCAAMQLCPELFSSLNANHFDVAIAEWFDICSLALFHRLAIKATLITSAVPLNSITALNLGLPMPAYVPDVNTASPEGTRMGLWQRILNYYRIHHDSSFIEQMMKTTWESVMIPHFGAEFPSPKELMLRASFLLLNTNEMLELARPISAKIKHIGGFLLDRDYPNSAINTLQGQSAQLLHQTPSVLVSFGSVADPRKMSRQMLLSFLSAFGAFKKFNFIWRFPCDSQQPLQENRTFGGERFPPNVHLFSWLDQRAMLAHPNLRAFVSHCGLNSLNEAAVAGVPILCVPLFGDQNYNGAIVNAHGNGIVLLKKDVGPETVERALGKLLKIRGKTDDQEGEGTTNKYARRAKLISGKIRRAPIRPREMVLKLVEYTAEFGGHFEELNLEGANMGGWAQNGWDFLVPIGIVIIGWVLAGGKICTILIRKLIRTMEPEKKKIS